MRQLWLDKDRIGWDKPVSDEMRCKWKGFFEEMFDISKMKFERSVKLKNSVGDPVLIIFSDASKEVHGAFSYVRWELSDDSIKTNILVSKSKLAPAKTITIVRLELLAAVISVRLRKSLEVESRFKFKQIFHIVDSNIVRTMIQRDSYGFNTFTSTKIGEIQEFSKPSEWYWVKSQNNIADLISRGESLKT